MIIKLRIKDSKRKKQNKITIWIQKHKTFDEQIQQVFEFFRDNICISNKRRFHRYYRIESQNPAILLSLFSAAHELIPEIYFNTDFSF